MDNDSYAEKLKDSRWQRKRLEILQRDRWTCRFCGEKDKTLHVHHVFYFQGIDPWDYPNSLLITLCKDCHKPSIAGCNNISCKDCNEFKQDCGCDGPANELKHLRENIFSLFEKIMEIWPNYIISSVDVATYILKCFQEERTPKICQGSDI